MKEKTTKKKTSYRDSERELRQKKQKEEEEEGAGRERIRKRRRRRGRSRESERELRQKKKKRSWVEKTENKKKEERRRRRRRAEKALVLVTIFFFSFFFFSYLLCRPKLVYRPKLAGMTKTRRNGLKFFPRWNKGVSRSDLHIGTRFSGRFGRNGIVYTTLVWTLDLN